MSVRLTLLVVLVAGLVFPVLSPAATGTGLVLSCQMEMQDGSFVNNCNSGAQRWYSVETAFDFSGGVQAQFSSQAFIDAVDARVAAYCSVNDCGSGSGSGSSSEELSPEEIASLWGAAAFLLALAYVFRTLRQTLWR